MKINTEETKIAGSWTFDGVKMIADDNGKRIDWLIGNYLRLISYDETGWLKLYQDPEDQRYWQLNFEHGEMHGIGPPSLAWLPDAEAKAIYKIED